MSRNRLGLRRSKQPGASSQCSPPTSRWRCAPSPSSAATIRASSRWSPSAAWDRRLPGASSASLASPAFWCRAIPALFRAFGMLVTDVHQTRSFTRITRLDAAKPEELEQTFAVDGAGRTRRIAARAVPARAAFDAAQRRHALPRPVLRSQCSGRGAAKRRRSCRTRGALPRRAPAALRPHGAIRGSRDRELSGHCGRIHSQTASPRTCRARTAAGAARNPRRLFRPERRNPRSRFFAARRCSPAP